jgi:hypothetical protein
VEADDRFQLTAFVTGRLADEVNAIRAEHDPVMAAAIAAHVTVLYDSAGPDLLEGLLHRATSSLRPFRLQVSEPRCWESDPGRGIYMNVTDADSCLTAIRGALSAGLPAGAGSPEYGAHVTLVHPRTVSPERANAAWQALRSWEPTDADWLVTALDLIERTSAGWTSVLCSSLRPAPD